MFPTIAIGVTREAPGEIRGYYTPGSMALGEFGRAASERVRAVEALFAGVGVKTRVVDNLVEARWQKLIWNVPFNGLAIAGGGLTTDRSLADPVLAAQVRPLPYEVRVFLQELWKFPSGDFFLSGEMLFEAGDLNRIDHPVLPVQRGRKPAVARLARRIRGAGEIEAEKNLTRESEQPGFGAGMTVKRLVSSQLPNPDE